MGTLSNKHHPSNLVIESPREDLMHVTISALYLHLQGRFFSLLLDLHAEPTCTDLPSQSVILNVILSPSVSISDDNQHILILVVSHLVIDPNINSRNNHQELAHHNKPNPSRNIPSFYFLGYFLLM